MCAKISSSSEYKAAAERANALAKGPHGLAAVAEAALLPAAMQYWEEAQQERYEAGHE
jgi:hypothetical protein